MYSFGKKINNSKVLGTYLFTDIVGSSKLWKKYKNKMFLALKKHNQLIYKVAKKYDGLIVKTIGDAFYIAFHEKKGKKPSFIRAIRFALKIQKQLAKKPIFLQGSGSRSQNGRIKLRIGMCYGKAFKQYEKFQGKKMVDFYGAVINTASRMESKVAKQGEVVIAFHENSKKNYIAIIEKEKDIRKDWCVKIKHYKKTCKDVPKFRKRSGRFLQGYSCLNEKILHGVGQTKAYIFTPNSNGKRH